MLRRSQPPRRPVWGRILADAVGGDCKDFDLFANTKRVTVPGAHWLLKPMVALGMLFYQIRNGL